MVERFPSPVNLRVILDECAAILVTEQPRQDPLPASTDRVEKPGDSRLPSSWSIQLSSQETTDDVLGAIHVCRFTLSKTWHIWLCFDLGCMISKSRIARIVLLTTKKYFSSPSP